MNKLKKTWNFLFGFKGRIGRLHFAIFLPFFIISLFVFNTLAYVFLKGLNSPSTIKNSSVYEIIFFAAIVLVLVVLVTIFKYSHIVRRIHDYDKSFGNSGLGIIIALVEIIGTFISLSGKGEYTFFLGFISIICLISLVFIKGTKGANQFGAKPIPFWKKRNITQK
ncbi:DUF805 domain-containing protein [Rodentibacter pneumotropicus]|uniref:DUF805 domain-containing protein n=1 Tax=Rodentibacter pneumotropicus TaxID=758 RepID=A0A4S2PW69_9PAST|nr:DUF805 domain-containing protein [Rodentibacter pneumotropicus]TGZ98602.1 DUF805 domain-containing protein [Rodentibacter pneumotropicus]THA08248.1 DUF805 domain-containing protein [Rodentibacter pneumotropicus]THA17891.1 DUF805 domain-containing protein [Rodentibacter pneumotropicus]